MEAAAVGRLVRGHWGGGQHVQAADNLDTVDIVAPIDIMNIMDIVDIVDK